MHARQTVVDILTDLCDHIAVRYIARDAREQRGLDHGTRIEDVRAANVARDIAIFKILIKVILIDRQICCLRADRKIRRSLALLRIAERLQNAVTLLF